MTFVQTPDEHGRRLTTLMLSSHDHGNCELCDWIEHDHARLMELELPDPGGAVFWVPDQTPAQVEREACAVLVESFGFGPIGAILAAAIRAR